MTGTASPTKPKSGQTLTLIAKETTMKAWDVIRNGRVIDTVFYDADCELWYVRKGLIEHDGYPCDIIVKPATR
jgi:hypothetical protein